MKSSLCEESTYLDYPITNRVEVSLSSLIFIFNELVQYCLSSCNSGVEVEHRLHEIGLSLGPKVLELVSLKEKVNRHETKIISMLTFIATTIWKYLFNHNAELLKSQDKQNEYMISDKRMLVSLYVSVPKDRHQPVLAAYVAGMVEGIMNSVDMVAQVSAHVAVQDDGCHITTLLISLKEGVEYT